MVLFGGMGLRCVARSLIVGSVIVGAAGVAMPTLPVAADDCASPEECRALQPDPDPNVQMMETILVTAPREGGGGGGVLPAESNPFLVCVVTLPGGTFMEVEIYDFLDVAYVFLYEGLSSIPYASYSRTPAQARGYCAQGG
jgi:hypothetical protein